MGYDAYMSRVRLRSPWSAFKDLRLMAYHPDEICSVTTLPGSHTRSCWKELRMQESQGGVYGL